MVTPTPPRRERRFLHPPCPCRLFADLDDGSDGDEEWFTPRIDHSVPCRAPASPPLIAARCTAAEGGFPDG